MTTDGMRVDKWLWTARFFKTRSQATAATAAGRVLVNGSRVKASHPVRRGDTLAVDRPDDTIEVRVTDLAPRRGSAGDASRLYSETEASVARRAQARDQRAAVHGRAPAPARRPDKRARRELQRFLRGD
jgi:ribosome-associated heat shock protein Hsp15